MRNITLQFKGSCAGCQSMHGANHEVSCDKGQLVNSKGDTKIYHLNKAYSNAYQWPLPGIPYKDWLKAKSCEFYTDSATFTEEGDSGYGSKKIRRRVV